MVQKQTRISNIKEIFNLTSTISKLKQAKLNILIIDVAYVSRALAPKYDFSISILFKEFIGNQIVVLIKIANFLANNSYMLAINLAQEMVYVGLPVMYVAAITGVAIEELNKLQQVRL